MKYLELFLARTIPGLTTLLVAVTSVCAAQSVNVVDGDVIFIDAKGQRHEITKGAAVSEAILSPDHGSIAYLKTVPGPRIFTALEDREPQEIWHVRTDGTGARKLTESLREPDEASDRAGLFHLQFAPDGKVLYFESMCAVVSACVHATNIADGTTGMFSDGSMRAIVADGRYRGHLVIGRHRYYPPCFGGGSYEEMFLFAPSGEEILDLGPDDPATLKAFEAANRSTEAEAKVRAAARATSPECPPDPELR